tara:strand:- start:2304 stop:2642 length:339 start_codon:yes stop_codon:yes gene_type:complete
VRPCNLSARIPSRHALACLRLRSASCGHSGAERCEDAQCGLASVRALVRPDARHRRAQRGWLPDLVRHRKVTAAIKPCQMTAASPEADVIHDGAKSASLLQVKKKRNCCGEA